MRTQLTPKQVARAIGVSESSLKRWCDRGLIPSDRTPGGHRRLPLSGVLEFLKRSEHTLVRPEVLGLPPTTGQGERVIQRGMAQLCAALLAGEEDRCRQIVFDLFLAGHSITTICDRVIATAFHTIGDRWACGEAEVYQERRACEITVRILHELRLAIAEPEATAPLAIGGTPEGDFYTLPTTMVELVLTASSWRATSLGSSLPFATLQAAIEASRPRLFWLSVSHMADPDRFIAEYGGLYEAAGQSAVGVVVGGRELTAGLRDQMQYSAYCDNLQHLESFLKTFEGTERK